ncbi:MAG: S1 RNA-binding domain-containing protein [Planctomycetaceae bacterium]|nr:S1 RNA-binding domain-containing protein [Planctomycetaceae bacterium]
MSLEENAVPDSSPESNSPAIQADAAPENTATQPPSTEQVAEADAAVAKPAEVKPTEAKTETESCATPAVGSSEGQGCPAQQSATTESPVEQKPEEKASGQEEAAPRVALNPAGAAEAKAKSSFPATKSEAEYQAEVKQQAAEKAASAKQAPAADPVDIPAASALDTDLEAELDAALGGSPSESEEPASETPVAEVSDTTLKMPKDDEELEPGLKLKGKVDAIDEENIVMDIGFRMSGILNKRNLEGEKVPELGSSIDVVVGSVDQAEGVVHLALPNKAQRARGDWNAIAAGQIVECTVEKTNKGGLSVIVSQLKGFMPAGQVDLHFVGDLEPFVGQKLTVKVIDVNPKKRNLVVSRRALLQEERDKNAAVVWENLTVGEERAGTVKTIKEYGAFVDIGGVDGLLHVRELSWTRIKHPSDVLKQGQQVQVKILNIDTEKKKISLGMRQLMENPWDHAEQKFAKNTIVKGTVKKITEFGAFVEIEEGLEGLIHVSELDFRRVNKVSDVLKEGQEVEAQVLEINKNKQRISLSIKALKPKPQASPEQVARRKADEADEKQRREAAEKRRLTLKGGNSEDVGGGLFGNPGDFGK